MDKLVELAIRMTADASDADTAFDTVGNSAKAMADDVAAAARTADDAARSGFDGVAESADALGSKTAQAAGGLGDLGGALSAMPGPLGAVGSGMESLAPFIMGVTGAADLLNLATESTVLISARAKAAVIAQAVATRAAAVASKIAAAGQWLLNAALYANPVGLVIIAVIALVAAVVLAYKKSETFRSVVQGVMAAVGTYVGTVVDIVTTLVEFVRDKAPAAWHVLKDAAVESAQWISDKVGPAFDALTTPIRAIIDLVQDLLDKIGSIDFPDLPDLNPFGKVSLPDLPFGGKSSTSTTPPTTGDPLAAPVVININVDGSGVVDENALGAKLVEILTRYYTRMGRPVQLATT